VLEAMARVMEPGAWTEYDDGKTTPISDGSMQKVERSIFLARRMLKRWPAIADLISPGKGVTASIQALLGIVPDPPAPPPPGHRGGGTYSADLDFARLNKQSADVWEVMKDGRWRSLAKISELTGHPQASVSARLRDFRKGKFGGHEVEREREVGGEGLHLYRLVPRAGVKVRYDGERGEAGTSPAP
jgi:hypothetical protein